MPSKNALAACTGYDNRDGGYRKASSHRIVRIADNHGISL